MKKKKYQVIKSVAGVGGIDCPDAQPGDILELDDAQARARIGKIKLVVEKPVKSAPAKSEESGTKPKEKAKPKAKAKAKDK